MTELQAKDPQVLHTSGASPSPPHIGSPLLARLDSGPFQGSQHSDVSSVVSPIPISLDGLLFPRSCRGPELPDGKTGDQQSLSDVEGAFSGVEATHREGGRNSRAPEKDSRLLDSVLDSLLTATMVPKKKRKVSNLLTVHQNLPALPVDATSDEVRKNLMDMFRDRQAFSEHTWKMLLSVCRSWAAWCKLNNRKWFPAEPEDVRDYLLYLQARGLAVKTIQQHLGQLNMLHRRSGLPRPSDSNAVSLWELQALRDRTESRQPSSLRGHHFLVSLWARASRRPPQCPCSGSAHWPGAGVKPSPQPAAGEVEEDSGLETEGSAAPLLKSKPRALEGTGSGGGVAANAASAAPGGVTPLEGDPKEDVFPLYGDFQTPGLKIKEEEEGADAAVRSPRPYLSAGASSSTFPDFPLAPAPQRAPSSRPGEAAVAGGPSSAAVSPASSSGSALECILYKAEGAPPTQGSFAPLPCKPPAAGSCLLPRDSLPAAPATAAAPAIYQPLGLNGLPQLGYQAAVLKDSLPQVYPPYLNYLRPDSEASQSPQYGSSRVEQNTEGDNTGRNPRYDGNKKTE